MADMIAMRSLMNSSIPYSQKSKIADWIERATGSGRSAMMSARRYGHVAMSAATEAGHVVRQGGESILAGAAHGALASAGKLDVTIPLGKGKSVHGPVDLGIGFLATAASIPMAMHEGAAVVAPEFRNVGCAMLACGTSRKTEAYLNAKKAGGGTKAVAAHGDHESIVKEALGLFP